MNRLSNLKLHPFALQNYCIVFGLIQLSQVILCYECGTINHTIDKITSLIDNVIWLKKMFRKRSKVPVYCMHSWYRAHDFHNRDILIGKTSKVCNWKFYENHDILIYWTLHDCFVAKWITKSMGIAWKLYNNLLYIDLAGSFNPNLPAGWVGKVRKKLPKEKGREGGEKKCAQRTSRPGARILDLPCARWGSPAARHGGCSDKLAFPCL